MQSITTGKKKIRSVKCCVLFDSSDGKIRHVHRVVTVEGAEEPSTEQVEKRTRQLAKELKLDVTKLHALHVDTSAIKPGLRYAVDPSKRRLVEVRRVEGEKRKSKPKQKRG